MAAVQDEAVTLAPGALWAAGFFVALKPDHPAATSADDLATVDAALSWVRSLETGPLGPASENGGSGDSTLFAVASLLECRDMEEAELRRLFPSEWRHEERDGARLLSFFCGEHGHVVLRAKEARTQRPHGHILRTGQALVPEESSLTSTVWMSGVFHSMVTQGHVSINRFLSTAHSWRSEEHTSELQSRENLVCRLLLEKKKKNTNTLTQVKRIKQTFITHQ